MQDDTPKVVAIAVRIVIAMWRILLQKFLFSISWKVIGERLRVMGERLKVKGDGWWGLCFRDSPQITQIFTDKIFTIRMANFKS